MGGWVCGWMDRYIDGWMAITWLEKLSPGWYKREGYHPSGDRAGAGTMVGREAEPSGLKSAVLENKKEL